MLAVGKRAHFGVRHLLLEVLLLTQRLSATILQLQHALLELLLLLGVHRVHFANLADGLRMRQPVLCSLTLKLARHVLQFTPQLLRSLLHFKLNINLESSSSSRCHVHHRVFTSSSSKAVCRSLSLFHALCLSGARGGMCLLKATAFICAGAEAGLRKRMHEQNKQSTLVTLALL